MPDLARAVGAVLPAGVTLGVGRDEPLWTGEALDAVPARRAEFARGRSAARAALTALGQPAASIPMRPDRAPRWPEGATGSISHCAGACLAIAGLSRDYAGLGLDIEPVRPIERALWPILMRPEERAAGADPLATFVAKEAAYKAQYPVSATLFDFHTLSVTWDDGRFAARFTAPVGPFATGHALLGRMIRACGFTVAICAIKAT